MEKDTRLISNMLDKWNELNTPIEERLVEVLVKLEAAHKLRLKLEKRIHNQRQALHENWEIIERRRRYVANPELYKAYMKLLKETCKLRERLNEKEILHSSNKH